MYFIIWEMHGSPRQFPKACEIAGKPIKWEESKKLISRKILQNPSYVENLGNWYSYFSHSMGTFFPLDSHSMVYCIICELHGFSHQFPIAWENPAKSIGLGEPKKLAPIFSLTYGHFSSIRFPSYGILYHMGNAWFFPSISNSTQENAATSTSRLGTLVLSCEFLTTTFVLHRYFLQHLLLQNTSGGFFCRLVIKLIHFTLRFVSRVIWPSVFCSKSS